MPGYADIVRCSSACSAIASPELKAPFVLGDTKAFAALLEAAGIPRAKIQTPHGTARFPSIESWVHTDVKGWTLADLIDDDPLLSRDLVEKA
jgi:hypothetical protein